MPQYVVVADTKLLRVEDGKMVSYGQGDVFLEGDARKMASKVSQGIVKPYEEKMAELSEEMENITKQAAHMKKQVTAKADDLKKKAEQEAADLKVKAGVPEEEAEEETK